MVITPLAIVPAVVLLSVFTGLALREPCKGSRGCGAVTESFALGKKNWFFDEGADWVEHFRSSPIFPTLDGVFLAFRSVLFIAWTAVVIYSIVENPENWVWKFTHWGAVFLDAYLLAAAVATFMAQRAQPA